MAHKKKKPAPARVIVRVDTVAMHISVPPIMDQAIRNEAAERGISVSAYLRWIVMPHLTPEVRAKCKDWIAYGR